MVRQPRITRAKIHQYAYELTSIDANGHVPVPRGSGLGVEIDWDFVRAHEVGVTVIE